MFAELHYYFTIWWPLSIAWAVSAQQPLSYPLSRWFASIFRVWAFWKRALIINTTLPIHLLYQILLFFQNSATIDCMNSLQQTPLAVAAAYNHVPIIEYLLKQGAEIETKDKDGYTPLLMVCCFCWNGVLFIFHIKNPPNYSSFLIGSLWG